uniref:Uncharacterized protein n=1 Tax=Heterorhabditis bacteriophora TaxID=37862 RepID=A0A1I7WAD3_HETBA
MVYNRKSTTILFNVKKSIYGLS